jgi:hypothetical protein
MNPTFPSQAWVEALVQILNGDERYSQVAHKWKGRLFVVKPIAPVGGERRQCLDVGTACRAGHLPPHAGDLPSRLSP